MRRGVVAFLLACSTSIAIAQAPSAPKKPAAPAARARTTAPAAAAPAPGRSICVAAEIGHKFAVHKVGLTILTNSYDEVAIDSWGLDDGAVRAATTILARHGYAARRFSLPAAQLAAFEKPAKSVLEGGELFHDYAKDLVELIRAGAASTAKCDFYLVIIRGASRYANTHDNLIGLGILQHGEDYWFAQHLVHAVVDVNLYDGATFKLRKCAFMGWEPFSKFLTGDGIRGMSRKVDKTWWPSSPAAAAQDTRFRDAMRDMIVQGLAETLPKSLAALSAPKPEAAAVPRDPDGPH